MIPKRFMQLVMMLAIMALVACGSSEAAPVAEVVSTSTNTAVPTDTAVPPTETTTAEPTDTPVPTDTAAPTDTPEPTETPTEVPTDTPEPTETAVPTNTAVPVTNTPVPAAPAAPAPAPASGAPPSGPNLIANSGFENGSDPWNAGTYFSVKFQTAADFAPFVHSGAYSAQNYVTQLVRNVQAGTNYRAGAWVRIWSSDGNDRNVSDKPGGSGVRICINANGDLTDDTIPATCSQRFQPLDTWQYITVDAIAISDQVRVFVLGGAPRDQKAINVLIVIDDVELGVSPVTAVATATPAPPNSSRPYPPAPVAFNASAMRDNMNNARSMLEQMGGLLDRLYRGSTEACSEYDNYYRSLVGSARYDGVPAEWQGVYNEYIFAVENGSNTNQPIFDLCFEGGGGGVTDLNYGVAREGINTSLNRLIPAIETANSLLSQ